jgi:hypothetical protein
MSLRSRRVSDGTKAHKRLIGRTTFKGFVSWCEPEGIDVGDGKDLACARTAVLRRRQEASRNQRKQRNTGCNGKRRARVYGRAIGAPGESNM